MNSERFLPIVIVTPLFLSSSSSLLLLSRRLRRRRAVRMFFGTPESLKHNHIVPLSNLHTQSMSFHKGRDIKSRIGAFIPR